MIHDEDDENEYVAVFVEPQIYDRQLCEVADFDKLNCGWYFCDLMDPDTLIKASATERYDMPESSEEFS